jgi:predicted TIM-barrel fold metal-dependent hydrolase
MSAPTSREVRAALDHPVIDADGHVIEFMPAVWPYLREALGAERFDAYRRGQMPVEQSTAGDSALAARRRTRAPQSAWWASPAANTRDLATAAVPGLLAERLDELGIDLAVLFPTKALGSGRFEDPEMRRGVCRGFNDFYAATYGPFAERLAVGGIIPMHTPDEAIAEIRHCAEIGLRVVAVPEGVWRPIPEPAATPSLWMAPGQTHWFDNFGLDSEYDYDPVWAELEAHGYPLISHGGLGHVAPNQYVSITNYSANHIGSFRDKMYQLCKSLYFGGVTRRFPDLRLGFLECGVAWASTLLADICEHWEKRNLDALRTLDPASVDHELLEALVRRHGAELLEGVADVRAALRGLSAVGAPPEDRDDWRFLEVDSEDELVELFAPRMYFGCEADDRTIAFAWSPANPRGAAMRPVFSSDIAHWDVPDMAGVVAESWELVDRGLLTPEQYRRFVCDNPIELFGPTLLSGTPLRSWLPGEETPSLQPARSI